MATRHTDSSETLTQAQEKRRAVVVRMLAERDKRPRVSQEEIRKMRGEGRFWAGVITKRRMLWQAVNTNQGK